MTRAAPAHLRWEEPAADEQTAVLEPITEAETVDEAVADPVEETAAVRSPVSEPEFAFTADESLGIGVWLGLLGAAAALGAAILATAARRSG